MQSDNWYNSIMKIIIEVPQWIISTRATLRYWYNSVKWLVNPPRCDGCGARMHAKWYHMEYYNEDNHQRLLVENNGKEKLCPKCISEEVFRQLPTKPSALYDYDEQTTCDCCQKEDTTTYKFYETDKIRLHFCLQWWNGFHVCRQCIMKAMYYGKVRTSVGSMQGNKVFDHGAYGLHLVKGKVKLFKWVKH